ncbi:hypothetical protein C1Y19_35065, partial [Pseudomonas sp. MPR-LB3]
MGKSSRREGFQPRSNTHVFSIIRRSHPTRFWKGPAKLLWKGEGAVVI